MTRLKDLEAIKGAKLSPGLKRALATSRPTVKTRAKVTPKPRGPRTLKQLSDAQALQASVTKARAKVKPTHETGDVLKGTRKPTRREADGLKREFEGRGQLAAQSAKLAANIENTNPLVRAAGMLPGTGPLIVRAIKDAINLPAQAVSSLYVPAAGVVEAIKGHPERLKKVGHDISTTDPVYAAGEAVVKGVRGDTKGAVKAGKRAVKLANEHPGFTAVEVAGLKGTVGRGVTRVERVAGRKPPVRPSATVPGTNLVQTRAYSKDAFTRAHERRQDTRAVKSSDALRAHAVELEKRDPAKYAGRISELRKEADRGTVARVGADPRVMSDAEIKRRASERVAVNETVRRENRTKVGQEVNRAIAPKTRLKGREKPTAAVVLHAQGITDASVGDLVKYKAEIAQHYEGLSAAGKKANRELQAEIQKAIDAKPDPGKVAAGAEGYAGVMKPRTRTLVDRGMLPAAAADKAPLVPYAVRKMGAKVTDEGPVHATTGEPIRAKDIRAHMQAHGVSEPTYVTQAPGKRGASAFFMSSDKPPSIAGPTRTGTATVKGTFSAHPDVLAEGAARAQGLIDAADGFTASVKEFAHQPTMGKLKNKQAADNMARELHAKTGVEYRPVRLNPFSGKAQQLQVLLDKAGEGGIDQQLGDLQPVREALEGAYKGHDGPGPWALVPRAAADEFAAHVQKMGVGPASKVAQLTQQTFRRAVLATSPTWFAGNLIEAGLRSSLARAGPSSFKLGRDVLKRVDAISPQLGQELRARAVGGGHFKSADTLHVRRGAEQFEGSKLEPIAAGLHKFWEMPGPKQASEVWNRWTDLVFRQVNGRIESGFQTAMLGRALRNSPLMDNQLPKLSAQAIDQAARGLTGTNEQVAFARQVERMYGKYGGFNAGTRWAIAMYTPFIPWTLNAVKFVYDVLPRDHPTTTALIAASEQWSDEWRKDHGLDLFMNGALPGFLQGSIPLGEGKHQRAPFRYTPFGAFGDPLATAGGAVLPQYQGVLAAFKGEDWKGAKLRNPDGSEMDTLGKSKAAAQAFTEATVPLLGIVKRVSKKGPAALNPLAPVNPAKVKVSAGAPVLHDAVQKSIDDALGGGSDVVQRSIDQAIGG